MEKNSEQIARCKDKYDFVCGKGSAIVSIILSSWKLNIKMDQRLVSENIMQCNEQSTPNFSAAGHLVAFKTDNSIKVKTFNK